MSRIQSTFTRLFEHTVRNVVLLSFLSVALINLNGCDSEPPALMKASKQFESDEIRDRHVAHMRTNHMNELMHKRDETVYNGIRTKKHSLNACIDCHVPVQHKGKVLRHTNPEHFCSTCHGYVAAKLDCFDCHVDHPVKQETVSTGVSRSKQSNHNFAPTTLNPELGNSKNQADKNEGVSLAQNDTNENLPTSNPGNIKGDISE